jgi:hypothetical protein
MPGPDEFAASLSALGHPTERRGQIVIVEVEVPEGALAGEIEQVAADPPNDFPRVPPHWIHLRDAIELPGGKRQPSELGAGWSNWSRKHPAWRAGQPGAQQWLAHTRSLLAQAKLA